METVLLFAAGLVFGSMLYLGGFFLWRWWTYRGWH